MAAHSPRALFVARAASLSTLSAYRSIVLSSWQQDHGVTVRTDIPGWMNQSSLADCVVYIADGHASVRSRPFLHLFFSSLLSSFAFPLHVAVVLHLYGGPGLLHLPLFTFFNYALSNVIGSGSRCSIVSLRSARVSLDPSVSDLTIQGGAEPDRKNALTLRDFQTPRVYRPSRFLLFSFIHFSFLFSLVPACLHFLPERNLHRRIRASEWKAAMRD